MEELRQSDRERLCAVLQFLEKNWMDFNRIEVKAIFTSMLNSRDAFVKKHCIFWDYEILRMLEDHILREVRELLRAKEFGLKFDSAGVRKTKRYPKEELHLAERYKKTLTTQGMIDANILESEEEAILTWMVPKEKE